MRVRRKLGHDPTHFEALTAIAFCWFAEKKVDWLVLEVGLGGRLDATNIIPLPKAALITSIGLEHQDILGERLGQIAREKAGILKPGGYAATIQKDGEAEQVIEKIAQEKGVRLWVGGRDFKYRRSGAHLHWEGPGFKKTFHMPGFPAFQDINASLAIAGMQLLVAQGVGVGSKKFQKGLSDMHWPGRLEVLQTDPLVLLDGAHNPDAAKALSASLKLQHPGQKVVLLNGFLKDKDYRTCAKIMAPHTVLSIVTTVPSDRAEKGLRIVKAWERAGVRALWVADWKQALELSRSLAESGEKPLLIMGSLYLGGACRREWLGLKGLRKL